METTQTFNTDILSIALMMLVLVIIPFYLIAKGKSYKPLKIGALILTVIMALLTVGLYVVLGLIYNSLAGLIGVFTLVLMLYYLLLYGIIRFQHQKNKHLRQSSMVFYILIILFFIPIAWSAIDFEGFSEFVLNLLIGPFDMK
ncbi:hypothetical protein OAC51_09720 [Flavobacteriaceae bacterium]|nr:hypothetical protein [Flavobacteriaceae bacterium]